MSSTINFEARKYIPFRIEELMFDFVSQPEKRSRNLNIIFAAIKKEIVDSYIKVFNQVGFNILALEPASLSFLRLVFARTKLNLQRTCLVLAIDSHLMGGDIAILDSGIPCFIRDIKLAASGEISGDKVPETVLAKLINEIRISIDYFRHQRLTLKNDISAIYLFSDSQDSNSWTEAISQELGIACQAFMTTEVLGLTLAHCDLFKATGASLRGSLRFPVDLSLLRKKEVKAEDKEPQSAEIVRSFVSKLAFKKCLISLTIVIFVIFGIKLWGNQRIKNLEKKLAVLTSTRQPVDFLPKIKNLSKQELGEVKKSLAEGLKLIKTRIEEKIYVTEKIERLSFLLPDGMWLGDFNFRKSKTGVELTLNGIVYLPPSENALSLINEFLSTLRADEQFNAGFSDIVLASVRQSTKEGFSVREFQFKCR